MWSSHLDVYCDDKLDWSVNTDALYKKGRGNFCPGSFMCVTKCSTSFIMQLLPVSFFLAVVCWVNSTSDENSMKLD